MVKKNPRAFQQYEVSFDENGNLTTFYYEPLNPNNILSWKTNKTGFNKPNAIFADNLAFVKCYSTNGSAHFIFESLKNGRKYSMFLSDFEDILKEKKLIDGHILQGEFVFCKKGRSQGLRMIIENQP